MIKFLNKMDKLAHHNILMTEIILNLSDIIMDTNGNNINSNFLKIIRNFIGKITCIIIFQQDLLINKNIFLNYSNNILDKNEKMYNFNFIYKKTSHFKIFA